MAVLAWPSSMRYFLDVVLDLFDGGDLAAFEFFFQYLDDGVGEFRCSLVVFAADGLGCLPDGIGDLDGVEVDDGAVSFAYFSYHGCSLSPLVVLGVGQILNFFFEVGDVREGPVDGGEADVGDLVEVSEAFHDVFADGGAGDLFEAAAPYFLFDAVEGCFELFCGDRAFF